MNRIIYISVLVSLLPLFTVCDMRESDSERSSGKAAVRVRIEADGIQARTVQPSLALQDVSAWELRGRKQGDAEALLAEFADAEGATVTLDPGTWDFNLAGYKDGVLILSGSIAGQTISLTGTNTLAFTVAPVLDGEGAVNIVIELPTGSGITSARIYRDETVFSSSITPLNNRITFETTHTVGDYYFSIRLYNSEDLYGVVSELVQVRANLASEKTYTLTWEDLNLTYVINYHLGEGETETGYYRYTDAAVMLIEPVRAGYNFEGWYDTADLSGDAVTQIPAGSTGDRGFYAKWAIVQYTVTFNADGGSPATQTRTVDSGSSLDVVTNITYSSVSGGAWTLQDDGRRQSPAIGSSSVTKARVSFTTATANGAISIQLDVSSESGCDYAFISTLDNSSATSTSGYYTGSLISGEQSVPVTIPVLTAGDHFIDIGYRKDGSVNSGSDCAWFKVTSGGDAAMPTEPTRSGYTFGGWWTAQNGGGTEFTTATAVTADSTVYAKWLPNGSLQISLQPVRDDPPLSNTALFVNESAQFSVGSGYSSYTWYWNGEVISGAASSTYTLPANSKTRGIYELSVVVATSAGEQLSARCQITIKAR